MQKPPEGGLAPSHRSDWGDIVRSILQWPYFVNFAYSAESGQLDRRKLDSQSAANWTLKA